MTRKPERQQYTAEQRAAAVQAYLARGEGVTARDIAKQHGVADMLLYHWVKRHREGNLNDKPGPKSRSANIVRAAPEQITIREVEDVPVVSRRATVSDPRDMLIEYLQNEVRRLRRALRAFADD